ncbi:MAG: hypothetical protein Kow0077_27290 [Anaerolineae bacterium]
MDFKIRSRLIAIAVLLVGIMLSGLFFFLNWAFGDRNNWRTWLMSLSYASFIGSGLIAFIIELGTRYKLPRGRVIGFFMVIGWVAASLFSTTLDTLTVLSEFTAKGLSFIIVVGGLFVLVIPGFLLMLLPWPPSFLNPRQDRPRGNNETHG